MKILFPTVSSSHGCSLFTHMTIRLELYCVVCAFICNIFIYKKLCRNNKQILKASTSEWLLFWQ